MHTHGQVVAGHRCGYRGFLDLRLRGAESEQADDLSADGGYIEVLFQADVLDVVRQAGHQRGESLIHKAGIDAIAVERRAASFASVYESLLPLRPARRWVLIGQQRDNVYSRLEQHHDVVVAPIVSEIAGGVNDAVGLQP